jgi:hypothetical protein
MITGNNFRNIIDASHIYKTKPESWLKFLGLSMALFGGFFWMIPPIDITQLDVTQYSVALFVYAIALLMEYIVKLVSIKELPGKIYLLIIVLCGISILFDSVLQWRGAGFLSIKTLNLLAIIPIFILFIDTLSITMIEKNESAVNEPENKLLDEKKG